jgi:hypothetical protein
MKALVEDWMITTATRIDVTAIVRIRMYQKICRL